MKWLISVENISRKWLQTILRKDNGPFPWHNLDRLKSALCNFVGMVHFILGQRNLISMPPISLLFQFLIFINSSYCKLFKNKNNLSAIFLQSKFLLKLNKKYTNLVFILFSLLFFQNLFYFHLPEIKIWRMGGGGESKNSQILVSNYLLLHCQIFSVSRIIFLIILLTKNIMDSFFVRKNFLLQC